MFLHILLILLGIAVVSVLVGAGLALIVSVLHLVFTFPYIWWLGGQHCKGQHRNLKTSTFRRDTRNAFRLYKSFFTGKPPVFL